MKVMIEKINGKQYTVIHKAEVLVDESFTHPPFMLPDGLLEWFSYGGTLIMTALPPLPRNPKPEDAPLLYRYMAEGLFPVLRDKLGAMRLIGFIPNVETGYWRGVSFDNRESPNIEHPEITQCIDKDGNKVEVAING